MRHLHFWGIVVILLGSLLLAHMLYGLGKCVYKAKNLQISSTTLEGDA